MQNYGAACKMYIRYNEQGLPNYQGEVSLDEFMAFLVFPFMTELQIIQDHVLSSRAC